MTLDAAFELFWNQSLPVCDTTMTPRLPRTNCECDTYPANLGPCIQMGELGTAGKCPYCDHLPKCHLREVFRLGWKAAPSSHSEPELVKLREALRNLIPIAEHGGNFGQVCCGCGRNSFEFGDHDKNCPVLLAKAALASTPQNESEISNDE